MSNQNLEEPSTLTNSVESPQTEENLNQPIVSENHHNTGTGNNLVPSQNFTNNSSVIIKICWVLESVVALGLTISLIDILRLYITGNGIPSNDFSGISSLLKSVVKFVDFMNFSIKFSIVCIVATILLLGYCLYKNRILIKSHIILKFIIFTVVESIYLVTQFPQINDFESLVNKIRDGNLGGLLGSTVTGDYNNINLFSQPNIIFLVVLDVFMVAISVIIGIDLFYRKNLYTNFSYNLKKYKIFACFTTLAVGVAAVICLGSYIYSNFIYKNDVSIMKYVTISYDKSAISGESTASISYNWPTQYKNNIEIENFIQSIQFNLNKTANISNGDKLEVQAAIDPAIEKKDRIKVNGNIFKDINVSGLSQYATSVKQISTSFIKQFESNGNKKIKENFNDESKTSTSSFNSLYTKVQDNHLILVAVYNVNYIYNDGFFSDTENKIENYSAENIILDSNSNVEQNNVEYTLDEYYVNSPDDLVQQGFSKVS